jgi:hypothetical protein
MIEPQALLYWLRGFIRFSSIAAGPIVEAWVFLSAARLIGHRYALATPW